jgi:hypothetical protein
VKIPIKFQYVPAAKRVGSILLVIGFFLALPGCGSTEKDVVDLVTKADTLIQSGAIDEAVKAYQKALKILPNIEKVSPDVPNNLVSSLIESPLPAITKVKFLDQTIDVSMDEKMLVKDSLIMIVRTAGKANLPEATQKSLFEKAIEAADMEGRDHVLAAVLNESLMPRLKKYTDHENLKRALQQPYIIGKIIPINEKDNEIDIDLFVELTEGMRAERLQDIGTIILTSKRYRAVGTMHSGAIAYRTIRDVKIVDKTISSIIDEKAFMGRRPLSVFSTAGGTMGQDPSKGIVAFLEGLPRKELPQ